MAAPSQVLFALHNSVEPQGFENLCVDLLVREGHSRIVPGGKTRDHGRDAEVRYWTESKRGYPRVAFQFSKESKWEKKLRRDVAKIVSHSESVDEIVFVSSQSITVEKQDKLKLEFRESFQVTLQIFEEGWFRVRLEENHIDLALKHLGVVVPPTPAYYAILIRLHGLTDENYQELLGHRSPEELRATLTAQTKADPDNQGAWRGLANVCYFLHDYDSALIAVSHALKLSGDEEDERWNVTALKASIIAEKGIESESRPLLNQAKMLFEPIIERFGKAADHYNLGNILGALEEVEDAERNFRLCLEIDPNEVRAWHNLGTLLIKLRRKEEGMSCLDQALKIKPDLLPAICTKASVLVNSLNGSSDATRLIERAFSIDPNLELRWENAHYWYAMALCKEERFPMALEIVEDRLERKFDCPYLVRLASDIFSKLWRSDTTYISKAEKFFSSRIDPKDRDYRSLAELMDIQATTGRESEAWDLLNHFLGIEGLPLRAIAERVPLKISDLTDTFASEEYYCRFRSEVGFNDYAMILIDNGLRPHNDTPEILFHFLMVSYYRMARIFEEPEIDIAGNDTVSQLIETYRFVSRIFSSFGGSLLAPVAPPTREEKVDMISRAILPGHDLPLMEASRLLGYLCGKVGQTVPEICFESVVDTSQKIHRDWVSDFLTNVGLDWGVEGLQKS